MQPRISVITINRNMAHDLAQTIASVTAQTYPHIEFLVIDGNSTDGSVDVIRQNAGWISYWVSERDKNLYDAMNKGARAATGEWVIFMNSGDWFADADVVRDVFREDHSGQDLVYGHVIWHYPREKIDTLRLAEVPSILPLRMNCSHQALFARRDLLLNNPFDDTLLVADYEFLLRVWRQGARFHAVDRVIARASAGGVSDERRMRSLLDRVKVLHRRGLLTPSIGLRYAGMVLIQPVAGAVRSLLPAKLAGMILKIYRRAR